MWQRYESRFKEVPYSPIEAHRYSVNQVEFSPDGSLLSSCSLDGIAALWHARVSFVFRFMLIKNRTML
jgi:WD40 repeat protein